MNAIIDRCQKLIDQGDALGFEMERHRLFGAIAREAVKVDNMMPIWSWTIYNPEVKRLKAIRTALDESITRRLAIGSATMRDLLDGAEGSLVRRQTALDFGAKYYKLYAILNRWNDRPHSMIRLWIGGPAEFLDFSEVEMRAIFKGVYDDEKE